MIWYKQFNGLPKLDITSTSLGIGFGGLEVQLERALFSVTPNSVSILALSDRHVSCLWASVADRRIARNFNTLPTAASNWTKHVDPLGANGSHGSAFASGFAVSPIDPNLVFIGSDNGGLAHDLYISRDGGASFTSKTCLHADLRTYAFAEKTSNGERWIIGNDGGVGEVSGITPASSPTPICNNLNNSGLTVTDFLGLSNSETVQG